MSLYQEVSILPQPKQPIPIAQARVGRIYIIADPGTTEGLRHFAGELIVRTGGEVAYVPNGGWDSLTSVIHNGLKVREPRPDEIIQITSLESEPQDKD